MESDEVGMKREAMRGNCLEKENVTLDFWSLVAFLYAFLIFIFCVLVLGTVARFGRFFSFLKPKSVINDNLSLHHFPSELTWRDSDLLFKGV